ncbi:MAG: NAD(P)H-dependent oxidoreductase [Rhizobiales bacterium]|jgi:chromate reductase|nr:NAD(P)H-dependent oxidoreductase [Hyphomicrobiales bacterium]
MARFKIALVVGSNRRESINRKLAQALAKLGGDKLDFKFAQIDDLPLYNQDDENNLTPSVVRFKSELAAADGILIVTPEHSRSIPAVLKNAIDWGARPWGKNSWTGKVVAVTGTSQGAISTALAQQHLRQILGAQGVVLAGGEAYLQFKPGLIDANDVVTDESTRGFLKSFLDQFAALVAKLAEPAKAQSAA